ncbi:MAG: PTS sugar transporter subunit IIA [Planctomycetes bacterium]|nr:PTS sugar transporter subunit IIA [Planctomycetota bacterium]MCB9868510.1 PTS sugar transporter subunit IIA [Planctomycetota bacterium]
MNKSLIERAVVLPALLAEQKREAFAEVLDALLAAGAISPKTRKQALTQMLAREELGSTGLGNGVAVPHVKEADVEEVVLALAVSQAGLAFDAIDGRPVHTMFVVLGQKGAAPEEHLQVLRWVSELARNPDFRRFARSAGSADKLRELLLEMTTPHGR